MLTWLFRSFIFFFLLMFKNKNKECVDLLTFGEVKPWQSSEAVTIVGSCIFLYAAMNLKFHYNQAKSEYHAAFGLHRQM